MAYIKLLSEFCMYVQHPQFEGRDFFAGSFLNTFIRKLHYNLYIWKVWITKCDTKQAHKLTQSLLCARLVELKWRLTNHNVCHSSPFENEDTCEDRIDSYIDL